MNTVQGSKKNYVTLEEMLEARDTRVTRQQRMLHRFPCTLICFTLNIAGPYKQLPLTRETFDAEKELILSQLHHSCYRVAGKGFYTEKTGCEGYLSVTGDAPAVKELMIALEDGTPLGRLFDIDVFTSSGKKISRTDLGHESRKCLICGKPVCECARSRTHSVEELTQKAVELMQAHYNGKYADRISQTALRALLYEVCVTPKPGLVDRRNNGAHRDMDMFTFLDSCITLTPYFREIVLKSLASRQENPRLLYFELKDLGKRAEEAMLKATGGVNTHKGAIFSIGLLCASLGFLHRKGIPYSPGAALDLCRQMTKDEVRRDLSHIAADSASTHGEKAYVKLGAGGARGEAASGYQSVRRYGLPIFRWLLSQGICLNDACVVTLLNLVANVQDTNILARTGYHPPDIRRKIGYALMSMDSVKSIQRIARRLDDDFIQMGISPGGCADLLALTLMLYFLEDENWFLP